MNTATRGNLAYAGALVATLGLESCSVEQPPQQSQLVSGHVQMAGVRPSSDCEEEFHFTLWTSDGQRVAVNLPKSIPGAPVKEFAENRVGCGSCHSILDGASFSGRGILVPFPGDDIFFVQEIVGFSVPNNEG